MAESLGGILGGLGLFLVGTWLLSENLKSLASHRFRAAAAGLLPNRYAGVGWGMLAGTATPSMSAMTFVVVGLLRAGFVSTERAFAVLIGGNIGASLIVLFVSLDIDLAVLYALAVAGLIIVAQWKIRLRSFGMALFGLAVMFLGLSLMRDSVQLISSQAWMLQLLETSTLSWWLAFAVAAVATFVLQSPAGVIIFAIAVVSANFPDDYHAIDHVIMYFFGSQAGSSLILLALSWSLTGTSRRIAMFQVAFNFALCAMFVPLFYVEVFFGVPALKALVESTGLALGQQVGIYVFRLQALTGIPLLLMLRPAARLYARLWPASMVETVSLTEYIRGRDIGNVESSLRLAALEQRRVLTAFPFYLDAARRRTSVRELRESTQPAISEIFQFLSDTSVRYPGQSMEAVNSMMTQQRLIVWLEEQFAELCDSLNQLPSDGPGERLRGVMVEGIDTLILTILDDLNHDNQEGWANARELTDDRSEVLRKLRSTYISQEDPSSLSDATQANILKVTNTAGEIFFLLSRLLREVENSSILTDFPSS